MKKEKSFIIMALIITFVLTSCYSNFIDLDLSTLETNSNINFMTQKNIEPLDWWEQVEYAMKKSSFKDCDLKNSVRLTDFVVYDTIKSNKEKEALIKDMFSDEAMIALPIENGVLINSIGDIRDETEKYIGVPISDYDIFTEYKTIADSLIHCGMYIAKATWNYRSKSITTFSVISNKTNLIVYDNIGTICPVTENKNKSQEVAIPRNSNITFTEGGGNNNKIVITDFSDSAYNIYGGLLWRYRIFSASEFNSSNTLIRVNNVPEAEGRLGWNCSAKMRTVAGDINVSNYHKFAYAYAYGFNISIGISWDGISFDISTDGGSSASGEITHNPL